MQPVGTETQYWTAVIELSGLSANTSFQYRVLFYNSSDGREGSYHNATTQERKGPQLCSYHTPPTFKLTM